MQTKVDRINWPTTSCFVQYVGHYLLIHRHAIGNYNFLYLNETEC